MINKTQEEIMKDWSMSEINNPIVSVKCMTYNQEKYISQCIDGFLMQKTSFPFEILIHDDCSTDGTSSIILEYENRFPLIVHTIIESENLFSKHDGSHHKKIDAAIKGKYIALCEGDDYWIDEKKLQMQVDFLEKNPYYGMCYTRRRNFSEETQTFIKNPKLKIDPIGREIRSAQDLLDNVNPIGTLTVCMRFSLYRKYIDEIHPEKRAWLMGDYPIWLWFAINSKIGYIPLETAVYRIRKESASHSSDVTKEISFRESVWDVKDFFAQRYNLSYIPFNKSLFIYQLMYRNCCSQYTKTNIKELVEAYENLADVDKTYDKWLLVKVIRIKPLFWIVRKIIVFLRLILGV